MNTPIDLGLFLYLFIAGPRIVHRDTRSRDSVVTPDSERIMGAKEDITAKVTAKGDELRELKKTKPAKDAVMKLVGEVS